MKLLLPLTLMVAAARAQFIIGALALIELTIEIFEAAELVAEIDVSVDAAITAAEASQTATVEGTVTNVGSTILRIEEDPIHLEGEASLSGFGVVSNSGPGFVQGTFTYRQGRIGVGYDRRSAANPVVTLNWGARTNGVRSGSGTRIELSNPTISGVRATNPGTRGTSVRVKSSGTRLFATK